MIFSKQINISFFFIFVITWIKIHRNYKLLNCHASQSTLIYGSFIIDYPNEVMIIAPTTCMKGEKYFSLESIQQAYDRMHRYL